MRRPGAPDPLRHTDPGLRSTSAYERQINSSEHPAGTSHTARSKARSAERRVTDGQIADALADGDPTRQASGRWEVRGRNGTTVITCPAGRVLIIVLPDGARSYREARAHCGVSRFRPHRTGPKGRNDKSRARR